MADQPTTDGLENAKPGCSFQVCVPTSYSVDQLRKEAKDRTGLDIHIKARVGPTRIVDGSKIDSPIEAVDDPYLTGRMQFAIPKPDMYLYVGYFKEPEAPKA